MTAHDPLCPWAPETMHTYESACQCALIARVEERVTERLNGTLSEAEVRADERERHHSGECDECAPYHEPLPTGTALAIVAGRQDERRLVREEIAQAIEDACDHVLREDAGGPRRPCGRCAKCAAIAREAQP